MKHISILVPAQAVLGSIEGPRQVFTEVNRFLAGIGRPPAFQVQLVGLARETTAAGGIYTIRAHAVPAEIVRTDLIIIPALDGDLPALVEKNSAFLPWITRQHSAGAEVASLCLGAFILAATGLVDGRQVATHWMAAAGFRALYPQVTLVEDRIITDEAGIYTSGGAFSYLNLILYLVEKYVGRDVAIFMSKAFQIDIGRRSQSPFLVFSGQKDHPDEAIRQAQEYIEQNVDGKITVDELATRFAIGRRNLERRFKKATANTVVEYIQRVRIEAAKMSFETTRDNVNEVMYNVGYTDTKAFRTTFRKLTGMSPIQYRARYQRPLEAAMA
jgi:transcriptional regulator GlxA family with amidase domain